MNLESITVTRLFDVMTIPIPEGTKRPIRNRNGYGLSFCSTPGGKIIYEHNGKEFVSDCDHAIFLPQGKTYMLNGIHAGDFPLINFYCTDAFHTDEFITVEISGLNHYLQTYEQIKRLCVYNQPACYYKALSGFYEILSHLIMKPSESKNDILSPSIAYMEAHYAEASLSIEEIAAQSHISAGYFRRIFKEQFSISPKKYILNARIGHAKELLYGNPNLSITEISLLCGFTNVYHFDRMFRAQVGCSPSEYAFRSGQPV